MREKRGERVVVEEKHAVVHMKMQGTRKERLNQVRAHLGISCLFS